MKNNYKIALNTKEGILYYNEDYNFFSEKHGTIYTNKQKALEKMRYAKKYGTTQEGKIEIIKL